jgi:hypothetical protein
MTVLPAIKPIIEKVTQVSRNIDANEDLYVVPIKLKDDFGQAWGNPYKVKTDIVKLYTTPNEDASKSIALLDSMLLKCAHAVELYDAYAEYMKEAERIKNLLSLSRNEWKSLGEDNPIPTELAEKIRIEIESSSELSLESKSLLQQFLTADKAVRKNDFGGYKGLSRLDPFQPVAATAFDQRIDYAGYVDDVIKILMGNRGLLAELLELKPKMQQIPISPIDVKNDSKPIPKPFLLLAGISGTGKTRFVREQAKAAAVTHGVTKGENHCLVPVRPDWHEPSDLLGYISRIGNGGARYVTTDLLRFIVGAWKHVAHTASKSVITQKAINTICPYWLCLDEMNLAPVEQYFADYLSILETRNWKGGTYSCEPLLKPAVIQQQLDETGRKDLWVNLGISDNDPLSKGLQDYFLENGIPLPPNLIVAGTVNMDETTHGFSRKVIDRAMTLDFGEFFPNNYQHYFESNKVTTMKILGFPHASEIHKKEEMSVVASDPDGENTIKFLSAVNVVLAGTPFELAYRALNEALLAVVCFNPADETELQAVWDDFLMMKVLPRIEGDAEKLGSQDEESLLTRLTDLLKDQFSKIIVERRDLLNQSAKDGSAVNTVCRSLKKLEWMQKRLTDNGFTSFWP